MRFLSIEGFLAELFPYCVGSWIDFVPCESELVAYACTYR